MIRFGIVLLTAALVISLLTFVAFQQLWIDALPSFFYQTLIFLVFTTVVIFVYLTKAKQPDFFVQLYLLTIAVKLLAYGGYLGWVILEDKAGASSNVVFFMTLYFVFTALEIGFLYHKISGQNK